MTINAAAAMSEPNTISSCRYRRTLRGVNASIRTDTMAAPKITIIGAIAT